MGCFTLRIRFAHLLVKYWLYHTLFGAQTCKTTLIADRRISWRKRTGTILWQKKDPSAEVVKWVVWIIWLECKFEDVEYE